MVHAQRRRPLLTAAGFTLLEVMLAVAILVVITVAVAQFTEVTVQSAEVSRRTSEEGLACNGLRHLLTAELSALPAGQTGALVGMNIKSSGGGRRDALQLIVPSGNGLLTPDARGNYQITLIVREIPRGSGKMILGLERQPWVDDDDDDDDDTATPAAGAPTAKAAASKAAVEKLPSDWVGLMDGVQNLEIAYFDARLNSWVDRWTDQNILPNLIRFRLTLDGNQPPYEIVARVPGGGIQRTPPEITVAPTPAAAAGQAGRPNPVNGAPAPAPPPPAG